MIVDGKVRKMKFTEKVRENFQKFKEVVERKGRDVLVAGIIGVGALFGSAKAQTADSLVIDTSSVHIDSTYIDWSKPRFMGLTYGYYKKEEEWYGIWDKMLTTYVNLGGNVTEFIITSGITSYPPDVPKAFPYYEPLTESDTAKTIKAYFRIYYGVLPTDSSECARYIASHPNKGEAMLKDWKIIHSSYYWSYVTDVTSQK